MSDTPGTPAISGETAISRYSVHPPPESTRAALQRLAEALRHVSELVTVTDASDEAITAAAGLVEQATAQLEAFPVRRERWVYPERPWPPTPLAARAAAGLLNPVTPPYSITIENEGPDEVIIMTASLGTAYEGPPGCVHGGYIAYMFDEVLGMSQSRTGRGGMTGTLTVKYRSPTPLYQELTLRAWVSRIEGRKVFAESTLHAGDRLCAESDAVFIAFPEGMREEMAARFSGIRPPAR